MTIHFLTLEDVIEIHHDQLKHYGGSEGLRDQGLLISSLAQPRATFQGEYLHKTLFQMAAAYLFHIVNNHPFIDGNKRTGIVSSILFLSLNGVEIESNNDDLEQLVLDVASNGLNKEAISGWIEEHSVLED